MTARLDAEFPREGDVWGERYRIERRIGVGGTAAVFSAIHIGLDQRVAIKILLPEWCDDEGIKARFLAEGRAASKIRSEHVVRVIDVDNERGRPYLVMEFLPGEDLDAVVSGAVPLPVATVVDYVLQACEALAEAHALGIIHRDLKPANLFLTSRADGSALVKLLDFGISKARSFVDALPETGAGSTQATGIMGSPYYMAPEQILSPAGVDARSDIWSLGAILYELLAGAPPFEGESVTAVCARVLRDPPPCVSQVRADVPEALEDVVLRCLQKDPSQRYATVADLARALSPFGGLGAEGALRTIEGVIEGPRATPPPQALLRAHDILSRPEPATLRRRRARSSGYVYAAFVTLAVFGALARMAGPHLTQVFASLASAVQPSAGGGDAGAPGPRSASAR